jgi:hypothetical protein
MSNNSKINYNEALLIESYFKSQTTKKYYLNVMNNYILKENKEFQNMYIRKNHGYAHFTVIYFDNPNESNFRNFDERKYYYLTRLQADNIVQIRADLISRWSKTNISDLYVLIIDESTNRVAEVSAKVLCGMKHELKQSQNLDFLWTFTIAENSLIWKKIDLVSTENEAKALIAQWQYLGNVSYAKYRENTLVKIISYDLKTRAKRSTIECKSIKQAYDLLKNRGFDMSYSTFKRRCNSEKPHLIETNKFLFYVTSKIDFSGENILNTSATS